MDPSCKCDFFFLNSAILKQLGNQVCPNYKILMLCRERMEKKGHKDTHAHAQSQLLSSNSAYQLLTLY